MFIPNQKQFRPPSTKPRWEVLFDELSLFVSLCLAWLMVLRTLRRERYERAARLKVMKLVKPAASETPLETIGEPQC